MSNVYLLPDIKKSRIGIIYVYYERKNQQKNQTNLSFFIKYGLGTNKWLNLNIENLFVINGKQCEIIIPTKTNFNVLKQDNCSDWEGWYNGIKFFENKYNKSIWEIFDYLCLINNSAIGPIYDENINDHWLLPFYNRMVKYNAVISSPCLSFLPNTDSSGIGPRVVPIFSLIRCTEHIITLLTKEKISCTDETSINNYYRNEMMIYYNTHTNTVIGKKYNKIDAILTGEYGLSRILIKNGYKVTSLLYDFDCHNKDFWSINNNMAPDRYNSFRGNNIPLTTIFIKNIWRGQQSYVSLPVLYNECIDFVYSKLYMRPILDISNNKNKYNYNLIKEYPLYNLSITGNSKIDYYNNFGYAEEDIIFINSLSQANNCVIYAHYDDENIIKDYVLQAINALIYVGYEIIFYTASEHINNIDPEILPFKINYIKNIGPGTDWLIWYNTCKNIIKENKNYDNILLLNDSIILPINGIDNFKDTIEQMRQTSDFWGHWESNEVQWHIIGCPFEFKYKILHNIITFLDNQLATINNNYDNFILNIEVKLASYLCSLGYKHNTVIKLDILENNITCPVFHPINIYKWINNPRTFATKWKYNISYIHPKLVSNEFNYLTRYLYYGKYGTISKAEKIGVFPKAYYNI